MEKNFTTRTGLIIGDEGINKLTKFKCNSIWSRWSRKFC